MPPGTGSAVRQSLRLLAAPCLLLVVLAPRASAQLILFAPGAERGVGGRGDHAVLGWGGTIPISLLYVSESAALAIVQILISKEGRIIFTIGIFCLSSLSPKEERSINMQSQKYPCCSKALTYGGWYATGLRVPVQLAFCTLAQQATTLLRHFLYRPT